MNEARATSLEFGGDNDFDEAFVARLPTLRWSAKQWAKRLYAHCRSRIPKEQALLRLALVNGDVQRIWKMLHPTPDYAFRRLPRRCVRLGQSQRSKSALFEYVYQDDGYRDGRFSPRLQALDYLCQGSLLKEVRQPGGNQTRRGGVDFRPSSSSDERRAAALRQLWGQPEYAASLLEQLAAHAQMGPLASNAVTLPSLRHIKGTTRWHRCVHSRSVRVLEALVDITDWCGWEVIQETGVSVAYSCYLLSGDLRHCRRYCQEQGYQAFVVTGSYAYFYKGTTTLELLCSLEPRDGANLYLAPGPRNVLLEGGIAQSMALHLDERGDTPLDAALRSGSSELVHLTARLGGLECGALQAEAEELQVVDRVLYGGLPHWLARVAGSLPVGGPSQDANTSCVVLESVEEIRSRVVLERQKVMTATGVNSAIAEALLRHHGHSSEEAIAAYRRNPQSARTTAHVPDAPGSATCVSGHELCCGICFAPLQTTPESAATKSLAEPATLRRTLPCVGEAHPFCDSCLRQYVTQRLDDGDVRGLVCPEPSCRLPLSEDTVDAICGPAGRVKFVQISAVQAVDGSADLTWCPRPDCGRAVARTAGLTVQCRCGHRFCARCLKDGTHEPASCTQWEAWKTEFPENEQQRRRQQRREESHQAADWIRQNAQKCPQCGASVQRTGGCNHMICRCGRHFCYVCGRLWEEHLNQPGGLDHFTCRLARTDASQEFRHSSRDEFVGEPLRRFEASSRCANGVRQWMSDIASLWAALHGIAGAVVLENSTEENRNRFREIPAHAAALAAGRTRHPLIDWMELSGLLHEAAEALLLARQTICFSSVLMWASAKAGTQTGILELWLGELEGACGTLEAALGPEFAAAATMEERAEPVTARGMCCYRVAGRQHAEAFSTAWPALRRGGGQADVDDFRRVAARLLALEKRLPDLRRLCEAVRRLTGRILAGARSGKCSGSPPGPLTELGQRFLSWLGY